MAGEEVALRDFEGKKCFVRDAKHFQPKTINLDLFPRLHSGIGKKKG